MVHGYPWLIHRLPYRRTNQRNLHVRGYKEEGTSTTPFEMVVLNDLDRFHLVADVLGRVPSLGSRAAHVKHIRDKPLDHKAYAWEHGQDMPEIREWRWRGRRRHGEELGGPRGFEFADPPKPSPARCPPLRIFVLDTRQEGLYNTDRPVVLESG